MAISLSRVRFLLCLSPSFLSSDFLFLADPPVPAWIVQNMLSEPKFADVAFQFDNKVVHAHSMIFWVRCQSLYQLYEKIALENKKKKRKGIVTLKIPQPHAEYPITSETFETLLHYLYADQIDFNNLSARQALDLSIAAHVFELPRLIRLSRDRVRETISLDNVHALLKVSHDTKEERVRAYCVNFASRHRKDFIGNKPEIAKIGVDLFQDVMADLMSEDENEISEPDPVPPKTLVNDFKKLHTDVDIGALSGDSVIAFKGADMQFHKAFFAIHSKSLSQSFQPVSNGDENTTEMLKVKTLLTSNDAFRAILRYLYYGDLSGFDYFAVQSSFFLLIFPIQLECYDCMRGSRFCKNPRNVRVTTNLRVRHGSQHQRRICDEVLLRLLLVFDSDDSYLLISLSQCNACCLPSRKYQAP